VELAGERTPVPHSTACPVIDVAFANFGDYGYGRFSSIPRAGKRSLRNRRSSRTLLRSLVFGGAVGVGCATRQLAPLDYLDFVIRVAPLDTTR